MSRGWSQIAVLDALPTEKKVALVG